MAGFELFLNTPSPVLSFALAEETVYLLAGNELRIHDTASGKLLQSLTLFSQPGLARSLLLTPGFIFCKDFITLYAIARASLEIEARWQLGQDLSSDICALCHAGDTVFASLRDGRIVRINCNLNEQPEFRRVSESAIWDMIPARGLIYAGNVAGQLLEIDPASLQTLRVVQAHRQNAKSLFADGGTLYSAGQDKTLASSRLPPMEVLQVKRKAHVKAFQIAGRSGDFLLSVCFPCGELKLWELPELREAKRIELAGCLTGETVIRNGCLYLASRAVNGLLRIELAALTAS